jgi:uncharacterized phage infection (PIP) family protein YhgE
MDTLLDQITTRQVNLELQAIRCMNEARRHRDAKAKPLFRAKMLEHRRIQNQMMQLQQYKENALAQIDALSNNEINQQFVRAMKGLANIHKGVPREEIENTIDEMQESMSQVKELSSMLGQPNEYIDDDELEKEFLEEEEESRSRDAVKANQPAISIPEAVVSSTTIRVAEALS